MHNPEWYGHFPGTFVSWAYRWHYGYRGLTAIGPTRHKDSDFEFCRHWMCRLANWLEAR